MYLLDIYVSYSIFLVTFTALMAPEKPCVLPEVPRRLPHRLPQITP